MVFGVGISCWGKSLAFWLGGSGVGARLIAGTWSGGGKGGSIVTSGAEILMRNGGGGGGASAKPVGGHWGGGGAAGNAAGDDSQANGNGGGSGAELLAGSDGLRLVPHVWSVPRQWQHKFVCNYY